MRVSLDVFCLATSTWSLWLPKALRNNTGCSCEHSRIDASASSCAQQSGVGIASHIIASPCLSFSIRIRVSAAHIPRYSVKAVPATPRTVLCVPQSLLRTLLAARFRQRCLCRLCLWSLLSPRNSMRSSCRAVEVFIFFAGCDPAAAVLPRATMNGRCESVFALGWRPYK